MKNNIGRKLTSLTLMTIMFAGGMTAAVPSIMPGIFAEGASSPGGLVSVSSSALQGASIMEIVIDDAAISALDTAIGLPTVTFSGGATSTLNPYQATDGKWYAYIVDDAASTTADSLSGLNFGIDCTGATTLLTLKDGSGKSLNTSGSALDFWWLGGEHGCHNPDGPASEGNIITNTGQVSANPNNEVLNDAPTPNRNSNANNGQIYAVVNSTSGTENGLWPFIQQVTMGSDNTISYGGETVAFSWGNQNGDIDVSFDPDTYANGADINLVISDIGLNIDPTTSDIWVFAAMATTGSETTKRSFANGTTGSDISGSLSTIGFGSADALVATGNTGSFCTTIATVEESGDATGVFSTPNVNGASDCDTSATATNHHTATYAYGGASANIHIAYHGGSISMDAGDAWMPAEAATVTINDPDANRTNGYDEALSMETLNSATTVPYIKMGSPLYLGQTGTPTFTVEEDENTVCADSPAASSGDLGIYELDMSACGEAHTTLQITVHHDVTLATITNKTGTIVMNYDVSSFFDKLNGSSMTISLGNFNTDTTNTPGSDLIMNVTAGASDTVGSGVGVTTLPCCEGAAGNNAIETDSNSDGEGVAVKFLISHPSTTMAAGLFPVAVDFFNFNSTSGIADAIYRLEAEENGTDGVFTGTVSYATMVHEGNSTNATSVISTSSDEITLLLAGDKTGASAPRVLYGDKDENNDASTIGAQLDANTHTGVVTFDAASYGTSSIVHVTVTDPDLNQDSGARESYSQEREVGTTANAGDTFAVSYNDTITSIANLKLVETGADTGVFVGQFLTSSGNIGNDLKLTYYDNKDASGTTVDTYASVKIATESGTISFDRQVYPVPFFNGWLTDGSGDTLDDPFDTSPSPTAGETHGNVTVYFTVSDGDEVGTSIVAADRVYIKLNGNVIATGGAAAADLTSGETGPLLEVEQGTSVYEGSFSLDHQETAYDTVAGACTTSSCAAFNVTSGMVLQAAYDDQTDDGGSNTVFFDSATVDLRTGSISTDKEVYVIGSDIVVTITDPDLNLDSDSSESYSTKLAEWDSSASSSRLLSNTEFAANPSKFIETGSNTGVFQTVFSFPSSISSTSIEQGEEVTLTYRDQGLSGKDAVHDDYSDLETTIYASNFGAIVELDRAIYDWTDRVLITVTAPDHNQDSEKVENIGTTALPIKVSTRQETFPSGSTSYTLAETSEDSGVFTGEYVLKAFADGNVFTTATVPTAAGTETGSADGVINTAGQTDGITVSYEYTDGSVSLASALIAWNIGEISFSDSSVSPGGSTVVTLIDGDLDKNPDVIDTKTANVFSDSDSGGISITLHETGEATGTFETTVFFTADDKSTGSLLRVSEGDTVTVEYTDQSLPEPYEQSDTLTFAATTTVGTVYPPLERAPASNARVVDAFGSQVSEVSADQQVQIAADVSNGTGKDQSFAYLVQVQDANGVTVSLAWITGALTSGQSMSPALSWTPSASGSYTATVFVWQSVDNPTALSPTVSVNIDVV